MTDADNALIETAEDIEAGLNIILPGKDPLEGMEARHEGGLEYSVISVRDGKPSYHWVKLGSNPSCTCADFKGNRKQTFTEDYGDREPCAHMAKAMLTGFMDPESLAVREMVNVTATINQAAQEARNAASEARDTARELDNGLVSVRDAQAGTASQQTDTETDSETSSSQGDHSDSDSAAEAATRLQEAYDNVFDGMEVEHSEGVVWVNKTPEAPDTLPGPGNVEVFTALLQEPDQIEYVHDNHDYSGAEPGQYFRNMIKPENVDSYIQEVLE